jgi:glucosylceramidase
MARTPIGGSDFSTRVYTYDDVIDDKNLTHFALQKEDLEYKVGFSSNNSPQKVFLFESKI